MKKNLKKRKFNCPAEMTLSLIGSKWKVIILWLLRKSSKRSGRLKSQLPNISPTAFSLAVRELESSGILKRSIRSTFPLEVSYELTPQGQTLIPIVRSLVKWGLQNQKEYNLGEFEMAAQYKY